MATALPIIVFLHVLAAIAAVAHVLLFYRRRAAAVGWIFAAVFLPGLGALAYLCLAVYQGPRSIRRRRRAAVALRGGRRSRSDPVAAYRGSLRYDGFPSLMDATCSFPLTMGNSVQLFRDDREALQRQLEAIGGAEREVLVQSYMLKPGWVVDRLREVLAARAAAGVAVRLLVDPIGCYKMPNRALREIEADGVRVATFLGPNPFKGHFQVNFRNHRKMLVVDGEVAFTGGRNWTDEYYTTPASDDGPFRDVTAELHGPVIGGLQRVFEEDWAVAVGHGRELEAVRADGAAAGSSAVRIVPSGSDEPTDDPMLVLGGALRAARESIFIATPYFVPGAILQHQLRVAARSGVRVELLVARKADTRWIDLAARQAFGPVLDAGARIWLRDPPLMHAKAVIVDGVWSLFGSANFDLRSLNLNYELNLEVLGSDFARELRSFFAPDFEHAEKLDPVRFRARGWKRRLAENTAALFSPLL